MEMICLLFGGLCFILVEIIPWDMTGILDYFSRVSHTRTQHTHTHNTYTHTPMKAAMLHEVDYESVQGDPVMLECANV